MRRAFWMTLAFLSLASVGAACTSFGTVPAPEPDASTPLVDGGDVPVPDAAPTDGSLPPPPEDAGPCPKISGPSTPCVSCTADLLVPLMPASADEPGPFVFGIAVDKTTLYWIEQSGKGAYDGAGNVSLVRARSLGGATGETPRTLARVDSAYTRIVVTPTAIWLASTSKSSQVGRIDKSCASNCTPKPMGVPIVASAVTLHDGGLALGAADGLHFYADDGSTSSTLVSAGVSSLTPWGTGLAYVSQGASAPSSVMATTGETYSLLSVDPNLEPYTSRGASHVAASCGEPLWVRQVFRKPVDGGELFHSAIVQAGTKDGGASGFGVSANVFSMVADSTHVYLGLPDSAGVRRVGKGEAIMTTVVPGVSAWNLAIDDTYVYFDDHGTDRTKSSVGLRRMKKSALP